MTVVLSKLPGERLYHRSKQGFYCECGADLNPHHAVEVDEWTAESNGYRPCPECFGGGNDEC